MHLACQLGPSLDVFWWSFLHLLFVDFQKSFFIDFSGVGWSFHGVRVHGKKPKSFGFSGPLVHEPGGAARFLCRLIEGVCLSLRKARRWAYCLVNATRGVRKRR